MAMRGMCTWNPKQPFINGCFNWMIPNHCIENGCFTKKGFQVCICLTCGESWASQSANKKQTERTLLWKKKPQVDSRAKTARKYIYIDGEIPHGFFKA